MKAPGRLPGGWIFKNEDIEKIERTGLHGSGTR